MMLKETAMVISELNKSKIFTGKEFDELKLETLIELQSMDYVIYEYKNDKEKITHTVCKPQRGVILPDHSSCRDNQPDIFWKKMQVKVAPNSQR